jgi:hypothetical protein
MITFYEVFVPILEVLKKIKKSIKKNITPLLIAIVLPWILTFIFIGFLKLAHGLSDELVEDPILWFRITIFYSFNLSYDLPVLGFGYSLCMMVWAVVGLLIGLVTRQIRKSLVTAMIGIGVTFILYLPLIYFVGNPFSNDMNIHPLTDTRLYENFTLETPYYLLIHILFYSFALPVLIMFTLIGSMLNAPREIKEIPPELEVKKRKRKKIVESKIEPVEAVKKKKELEGFAGILYKLIQPLNVNDEFREEFKDTSLKILLNPIDQLIAALIIFDKGTVDIEDYKKYDKLMEMNKKQIGYDALLQVSTKMLVKWLQES